MNHKMHYKNQARFQRQLRQMGLFLAAIMLVPWLLIGIAIPAWSDAGTEPKSITIGTQEVIQDDLYLVADTISIDGTVKGDAVLAANQITVNGTVEGDLIAAGRIITLNGTVKDDVRLAGQVLVLGPSARVNDDVVAAGYSLEQKKGSAIAGNLYYFGGQGLLAGTVQQNIRGAAAALQIAGPVKGQVTVTVGNHKLSRPFFMPDSPPIPQIPAGLSLTDAARIGGQLTYRADADAQIAPGATVAGRVVREDLPTTDASPPHATPGIFWHFQRLVALGLVGWLLLRLVPGWIPSLSATVQSRPLPSFGWGLVTVAAVTATAIALLILMPLLLVISGLVLPMLVFPVLGIGLLAVLALGIGFGIVTSFVPPLVVSFLGGQWLMARLRTDQGWGHEAMLAVGLVGFVILTTIPGVGDLVSAITLFLGLGGLWLWWRQRDRGGVGPALVVTP